MTSNHPDEPAGQAAPAPADDAGAPPAPRRGPGSGVTTAWRTVTDWRRRRPFWGGLLLIGSGVELLMIPLPVHAMGLILHIGTGGVLGILIGAILIVCGLLLWFSPAQRVFYSIVAVLLAVSALVASNLGGFLLGTLLGVIGGSLGFAWTPDQPGPASRGSRRRPGRPARQPGGLSGIMGSRHKGDPAGTDHATTIRGYAAFPLVLVTVAGLMSHSPAAASGPSLCLPGLPTIPILNPCPSPSPTPGGAGPTSSPSPTPSATANTSPGPRSPSPTPRPRRSPSNSPSPSPGVSTPGASPSLTPRTGTPPAFAVATAPSSLTATSALITGFAYDGVVTVHTISGTVRLMQFTMTSLSLTAVNLTTRQDGQAITTTAPSLSMSGTVTLYASKLSGDLLGVPVTITPDSPLATILAAIKPLTKAVPVPMTNVVTDQPFTSASGMRVSGLSIS